MGLREDLFAKCKARTAPQPVPTPEWPDFDGHIFVRKLTAGELDGFFSVEEGGSDRARFMALVACDDKGERLFQDTDIGDIAALSFEVVDRIVVAGQRFNGLLKEQRDDKTKN